MNIFNGKILTKKKLEIKIAEWFVNVKCPDNIEMTANKTGIIRGEKVEIQSISFKADR